MSTSHLTYTNPWSEPTGLPPKSENPVPEGCSEDAFKQKVAQIAERELRESEQTRSQCLIQFKDWIRKNEDIEDCILDDNFLGRFLRVKKYSIPMAQQTLLKYLNFRQRFRDFAFNMDYLDGNVAALINNGYVFASPFRDSMGRRVVIYNLHKFNLAKFTNKEMSRAHFITYETLLDDEANQVLGITHVGDIKGATPALLTLFSVTEFATLIRWGEQSLPIRHKAVNFINLPTSLKYVFDFFQSNLRSQKIKERCFIHETVADLHRNVNRNCLPQELGGVMPMKDMVDLWKKELASKRDRLLQYDRIKLLSDKGIITSKNKPHPDCIGDGSLSGSFRKLEVD